MRFQSNQVLQALHVWMPWIVTDKLSKIAGIPHLRWPEMTTNPPEIAMNPHFNGPKNDGYIEAGQQEMIAKLALHRSSGQSENEQKIHLQVANATGKMWENDGKGLYKPSECGGVPYLQT